MTGRAYDKPTTALLVIDPYNDFISEGGKAWPRIRAVAEANRCVPHMLQVLNVGARGEASGSPMHCIVATVRATTRHGNTSHPFRGWRGQNKTFEFGHVGWERCIPGSRPRPGA